jgi:hypothetical protein
MDRIKSILMWIGGVVLAILAILVVTRVAKKYVVVSDIPKDRVDPTGKLIPIGTPDTIGYTQWEEMPFSVGILSGGSHYVQVGDDKVELPTGLTASDVHHVIQVKPDTYAIAVEDHSGVNASTLLGALRNK